MGTLRPTRETRRGLRGGDPGRGGGCSGEGTLGDEAGAPGRGPRKMRWGLLGGDAQGPEGQRHAASVSGGSSVVGSGGLPLVPRRL